MRACTRRNHTDRLSTIHTIRSKVYLCVRTCVGCLLRVDSNISRYLPFRSILHSGFYQERTFLICIRYTTSRNGWVVKLGSKAYLCHKV